MTNSPGQMDILLDTYAWIFCQMFTLQKKELYGRQFARKNRIVTKWWKNEIILQKQP